MTREQFQELVTRRNQAKQAYIERRSVRDEAKRAAKKSLRDLRAKQGEVKSLVADIQRIVDEHQAEIDAMRETHRDLITERDETDAACQRAWHEYRELDMQVPEARAAMLGL